VQTQAGGVKPPLRVIAKADIVEQARRGEGRLRDSGHIRMWWHGL